MGIRNKKGSNGEITLDKATHTCEKLQQLNKQCVVTAEKDEATKAQLIARVYVYSLIRLQLDY